MIYMIHMMFQVFNVKDYNATLSNSSLFIFNS